MKRLKTELLTTAVCGIVSLGVTQLAHANLVSNGNFTFSAVAPPAGGFAANSDGGQMGYNISVPGWTSGSGAAIGYNFVSISGGSGLEGMDGPGGLSFWGNPTTSSIPGYNSGNYAALDSNYPNNSAAPPNNTVQPIQQTVSLTPGSYTLTFWWADAQQTGYSGTTSDQLAVTLGTQTFTTASVNDASESSTPFVKVTDTFTVTTTGPETLSFLASGTPLNSEPPFALLADVDLEGAVPDGGLTIALFGGALVGLEAFRRKFTR